MGSFVASIHKLSKHLTLRRSGRNDTSAKSPAEEAATTGSPRSSAEDASPRFCLSLPALRRPDDRPSYRLHVTKEVTLPVNSKTSEESVPFRPPGLPPGAPGPSPQLEPSPSMPTLAQRQTGPSWVQFLAGQKTAGEDASSYCPSWSELHPTARLYFESIRPRPVRGSERVPTKCGTTLVVMRPNPFPMYAVSWKEVEWNRSNGGVRNDQVEDEDQAEGGDDQVGDEPLATPPRPRPCSLKLRRGARSELKRSEKNGATHGIARSLVHPHAAPRLWAALHRFSPWDHRKRPSERLTEPAHRTASPSLPSLHNGDDIALHGEWTPHTARRRGAASQGRQTTWPKSECWWVP